MLDQILVRVAEIKRGVDIGRMLPLGGVARLTLAKSSLYLYSAQPNPEENAISD
jgi:hypothetical protein